MENNLHIKTPTDLFRPKVKEERTGWRDEWISNQHRKFGYDAPMVDIDFLGIEYDNSLPVALIEYKHYNANINLSHPSIKAQSTLATNSNIPFFVVVYYPETSHYFIYPINLIAQKIKYCEKCKPWTESNFVKLLYFLRKKTVPQDILDSLSKSIPDSFPMPNVR